MGKLVERRNERIAEDEMESRALAAETALLEKFAKNLERDLKGDIRSLGHRRIKIERNAWSLVLSCDDQSMTIEPISVDRYQVGHPKITSHGFFQIRSANKFDCDERQMLDEVLRWVAMVTK